MLQREPQNALTMASLTLKDLMRDLEWQDMPASQWGTKKKLQDDQVAIGFSRAGKESKDFNKVRVRLGATISKTLGWRQGDSIVVTHHPDHVFALRLLRSEAGTGYRLHKGHNTSALEFQFTWKLPVRPKHRLCRPVEFTAPRDEYIAFIVDFPEVTESE